MMGLRNLKERVMVWYRLRVRRRQLRRVLWKAYIRFAQEQPKWAASLFDEHFLMTRLLPLLNRGIDLCQIEAPLIADAWQAQLYPASSKPLRTRSLLLHAAERYLQLAVVEYANLVMPHPRVRVQQGVRHASLTSRVNGSRIST